MQGISLLHTFDLSTTGTELKATLRGSGSTPGASNIAQAQVAASAVVSLGATLVADGGMSNAMTATKAVTSMKKVVNIGGKPETVTRKAGLSGGSDSSYGLMPFAAASGGSLNYNVGDGTDVKGLALMTGLAKRWEGNGTDVTAGAFFEAGWGDISSYTDSAAGRLTGKTDANYQGGGVLARLDVTESALQGLYTEASVRVGHLSQKYHNNDVRSSEGRTASYDHGSLYYGLHAGLGYNWNISEAVGLDMSAKYFWNHQQGGDVRIADDPYSFDAVNSHRVRAGARVNYAVNEKLTAYTGAAWEYEFDGKSRATAYGMSIPSPTVKGSTGVGEVGLRFKPLADTAGLASTFSVAVSLQGFVGKCEGVMGNMSLGWEF